MVNVPCTTYSQDFFLYWRKVSQECCNSLKKNRKIITQVQEYSVILKNVFPFFAIQHLDSEVLGWKMARSNPQKNGKVVSKESIQPWIGLRSWKGDFWSKITALRFWLFCSSQKYLCQERTANKSQALKCTFIISEKSIRNTFPAQFKLKYSLLAAYSCALAACCNKKSPLDTRKLQNFIQTMTSQPLPIMSPFPIKILRTEPRGKHSVHTTLRGWGFIEVFRTSQEKTRRILLQLRV